jgi:hypothetical protein
MHFIEQNQAVLRSSFGSRNRWTKEPKCVAPHGRVVTFHGGHLEQIDLNSVVLK